jgi:hypothetical protein
MVNWSWLKILKILFAVISKNQFAVQVMLPVVKSHFAGGYLPGGAYECSEKFLIWTRNLNSLPIFKN